MRLLSEGLDKAEIFEKTGNTVGVQDAGFAIREGEIFVVMGLSGSGKSTLVRLLNRLIEPTAGRVLVKGQDVTSMSARELIELRRHDMSMVFQSFALMPHRSVLENAAFGLEVAGVDANERRERALAALDQVGLKVNAESYPHQLSGGMQQRVGLARALAGNPSILLMDEAFSALDPLIRTEMQDELIALQRTHRRTIVFISHDLDEAMRIGDRIAIMQGGSVVQVGTPQDIVSNPANDYVRSFFHGVDVSRVYSAADICDLEQETVIDQPGLTARAALDLLNRDGRRAAVVVDSDRKFLGVITVDSLTAQLGAEGDPVCEVSPVPGLEIVKADAPLNELIGRAATSPCSLPVVDGNDAYLGSISKTTILQTLGRK
ncbi:MAG: glycine betaine/L-proline ABC transporter ATP-binding protein ProV, partial [Ectothiorhodospiraceae bacterium]